MCGRFSLNADIGRAARLFGCESSGDGAPPRYNIAPTQPIHVIFQDFSRRVLRLMRWGFVPSWVKEPENFTLIVNARCESVAQKPSFRAAIRHRRCIIPATGFYEWHREGKTRTPYFIGPKDGGIVGYAGIYETYSAANGSEIDTVCFLTTVASADIAPIHRRMPVRVPPEKAGMWLDCANYLPRDMAPFYENSNDGLYGVVQVSARVNSAKFDDPGLQEPVVAQAPAPRGDEKGSGPQGGQLSLF